MSLDRIFDSLISLGLSENEIRVYFYIAKKGPSFARDIINDLPFRKRTVYRILKKLKNKKIISSNRNIISEFTALPFEEVLNMLIEQKNEEAKEIKERKKELIFNWKQDDT